MSGPEAAGGGAPVERQGPLKGLRVIETGSIIAGPFCGHLMADWGADVIKVEPPRVGDPFRAWGGPYQGRGLWWSLMARNKQSITLDLRRPEGQALLRRLAERADILIENFRPGTLEGWNLGPDVLREVNPRLVIVRVSGYGQTGPYRLRAGFGAAAEAMGGIRHVTGQADGPPTRPGVSIGDALAAMYGALGALSAIYRRDVAGVGRGDVIDVAIYEAVWSVMESLLLDYDKLGKVRGRTGSMVPGNAPSNVYPAAGGEYVVIGANADNVFRRLCEAMGQPELATDPRYATHHARGLPENQGALDDLIAAWTSRHTAQQVVDILAEHGVPCSRIYTIKDIVEDPHYAARDMILRVFDPVFGEHLRMQGIVPKFEAAPGEVAWTGPALGQHNDAVYGGVLGLSREQIERLRQEGVI